LDFTFTKKAKLDKELLKSLAMPLGLIIVCAILYKAYFYNKNEYLNFEGAMNLPDKLKPPKIISDGDKYIKTDRHELKNYIK
jgi:hypothetical protein